jgi:peroxiredoxin
MRSAKALLFSLPLLLIASFLYAQKPAPAKSKPGSAPAYSIKVKINGLKDTVCYLAHYYGDSNSLKDTAKIDSQGKGAFEGKEALPGGIYLVVLPSKKYFEIMIDKEQNFSLETDTANLVKSMKIKGSKENELFYEYLHFIDKKHAEITPLRDSLTAAKGNKEKEEKFRKQTSAIDKEVKDYKLNFIKQHPETFGAVMFRAMQEPEVPENPDPKDSTFAYRYFKAHFWDNIDFSDERLIRTPLLFNKIKQYLDQLTVQHPDSIIRSIDVIVPKAKANKEIFKVVVAKLTYQYESSKIMGMDAVFVHLVKNYYTKDQAYWVSAETLKKIQDRAAQLEKILIGKKVPPVIMADTSGKIQVLHNVKAQYTVLYFWEHNCSHCKKETPKLLEYYHSVKDKGVEVFAVETSGSPADWKKAVKEYKLDWINVQDPTQKTGYKHTFDIYSTPVIYVLDAEKKIIAKRIDSETLQNLLNKKLGLETKEKPKDSKEKQGHDGHGH